MKLPWVTRTPIDPEPPTNGFDADAKSLELDDLERRQDKAIERLTAIMIPDLTDVLKRPRKEISDHG